MRLLTLIALALPAFVLGSPLEPRQTTNTNAQILRIVGSLSQTLHVNIPGIVTLQAQRRATDATVTPHVNSMITAFNTTTNNLRTTPVSAGSTTVFPTNDDVAGIYGLALQFMAGGLSGITTTMVPSRSALFARLDPVAAAATRQLNITLPGALTLINPMMRDARQFLTAEGLTQTVTALGF